MVESRQNSMYPANLTDLLAVTAYQQNNNEEDRQENYSTDANRYAENADHFSKNADRFVENTDRFSENADRFIENGDRFVENADRYTENIDRSTSPSLDDGDSSQSAFGVDLTGKGTNLAGKSFTIAAILGLTNSEDDVMNLSVQERFEQNQRQLQNYLYAGHGMQRLDSSGFCRSAVGLATGLRQDSPRPEPRPPLGPLKGNRQHSISCSSSSGRSKRIRTIFTPEQLERLEAEFERQQYMVGPERLYLAHALQLTEAQVKVWFQNRRIKWRKHHLEVTQQRLAVLQRHRQEDV